MKDSTRKNRREPSRTKENTPAITSAANQSPQRLNDNFEEAVSILDGEHGFGGALWMAEMNTAFDSKERIDQAEISSKNVVLQGCLHNLRETMAAEVECWAPKYVKLAIEYPDSAGADPIEWAHSQMQQVIDKRLRIADVNGAVGFFLITISHGDAAERDHWKAPVWMFSGMDTALNIRLEHNGVRRRLEHALALVLARTKLEFLTQSNSPGQQPTRAVRATPVFRSELRKQVSLYLRDHSEASNQELLGHLRMYYPTLIPSEWDEDESLAGKTFNKVRRALGLTKKLVNRHLPATLKKGTARK